jgi:tRNA-dihydrouridine synthase B
MESLKIGKLKLKNRLFLAPMVDVTDLPYRILCRRAGAGMAYTEMIYVDAILHENERTLKMMKTSKEDSPIGLQITGDSVEEFERFAKLKKVWKDFDLIDLNCGCPSMRITGNKAGSYLLKNPEKIAEIVKILKKTGKIVTVKIRLGYDKNNVLEVAREIEKAGADALTVHARLGVDGSKVKADWSWIKKVKESVKIPVIGNGDVFSGEDAFEMLKVCDGVMIGRGAIGDPLIFSRINEYLNDVRRKCFPATEIPRPPAPDSRRVGEDNPGFKGNLKLFLEYLNLEEEFYGKDVDLRKIKYVGTNFFKGFSGASKARERLMRIKSFDEIKKFVKGYGNI